MITRVGVIGTGVIAVPLVRSLLRRFPELTIVVSPRSADVAASLAAESPRVSVASGNQAVLEQADTVLLCLLARVAREVLPGLTFHSEHQVISVMVDYPVAALLSDCQPCTQIEMTIPLPFIETGDCPLPCYPSANIISSLYGDDNAIVVLESEGAMQPYIAATGIVAQFVQGIDTAADWLGAQTGNAAGAESYVLNMLAGYLHATRRDGNSRLKQVLQDLSTEGGLNAQLLKAMHDSRHYEHLRHELDVLLKRLTV